MPYRLRDTIADTCHACIVDDVPAAELTAPEKGRPMTVSERFMPAAAMFAVCVPGILTTTICGIVSLVAARTAPAEDLYSVVPGEVVDPDIVWSKLIPVVGSEITILARVRGSGQHPVDVQFSLRTPGGPEFTLAAGPRMQQTQDSGFIEYEAQWKPSKTGLYSLTIDVDPQRKTNDSVRSNNSASVTIPVTWQELHILAWGQKKRSKWITTAVPAGMSGRPEDPSAKEVAYWHRRGSLVLGYMYTREQNLARLSEEQMTSIIVKRADEFAASGCDGLIIDETGSYATPNGLEYIRRFGAAYAKVREKHPHLRVYNWIAGPMHIQELENARKNGHILMAESYEAIHARFTPTFEKFLKRRFERLETVFGSGLQSGGLIALGLGGDGGRPYRPQIESSVRLCRRLGPIAPGICWYGGPADADQPDYEGSFEEFLDRLTMEYFIKPVLSVDESDVLMTNYTPVLGEEVPIQIRVHNIGGMRARGVGVRLYVRNHATSRRTLLATDRIPEIGNGMEDITDDDLTLIDHKVIDGTRYSASRLGDTLRVLKGRALMNAIWTPRQAGYYSLEVELQPAESHTILAGFATRTVPVVDRHSE